MQKGWGQATDWHLSGLHHWCFDTSCWVTDRTSNLCHLCPRFFCVQQLEEEYLGEQLRGSPENWPLKVEVMVVVLLWELYPSSPGLLHIYIFSLYRFSDTHHISCCIWYFNRCLLWCYLQASEIEEEGPEGKFAAIQSFQSFVVLTFKLCILLLSTIQVYPQFSAHVCYGQMAGWMKMPLGTEVGLGPDNIVLHGDPALPSKNGAQQPPLVAWWLDGSRCHLIWR